jgi:hypothetical protein
LFQGNSGSEQGRSIETLGSANQFL